LDVIGKEAKKLISTGPQKSVRTFTDVTNMQLNKDMTAFMKDLAAFNAPYVLAAAVVGVAVGAGGLGTVAYSVVKSLENRNMSSFDTTEAAREWLATQ
jgi:ABC-type methionine transport system permease subunit